MATEDPKLADASIVNDKDANLVDFTGDDDKTNPKNWPLRKKWLVVFTVSMFAFLSPVASTMIAPALPKMDEDLDVRGGQAASQFMLSIFFLGYAIGPLLTSPLSEIYGRVVIIQLGNLIFLVFNLACGFARSQAQMTVLRFFAGIGGSTSFGIEGGIIGDTFRPEQRGLAVAIYNLLPLLGPALGPIIGAFITESTTWRWTFWSTSIADAAIQLTGLFILEETWAPAILTRKKKRLMRETGNTCLFTEEDIANQGVPLSLKLRQALIRPAKMLATQVIVQALCLYLAYLYGVAIIVLSTFTLLWTNRYGYPLGIGSLNYIALALGYTFASQISSRVNDKIYLYLKEKYNGQGAPEYRLPILAFGATLMPMGLLIYAWSAQYHVHWMVVDVGVGLYAAGTFTCFQALQTYVVETYTTYGASAFAAVTVLRSIFAAVFPLFAPIMYERLDYGWGNTTLALVVIVLGWPASILLWKYGPKLRAKSPYAADKT